MLKFLRSTATLVALVIGIAGGALVLYAWRLPPFTSSVQTTDNAYVRGQVTIISPQLNGYIAEVAVQDYQKVKAGQANWERIEPLLSRGVTTQKEADQARAGYDQAKAALSQAQAAVEVARQ